MPRRHGTVFAQVLFNLNTRTRNLCLKRGKQLPWHDRNYGQDITWNDATEQKSPNSSCTTKKGNKHWEGYGANKLLAEYTNWKYCSIYHKCMYFEWQLCSEDNIQENIFVYFYFLPTNQKLLTILHVTK